MSSKEKSKEDKSGKRREKDTPARRAPAKKKRARVLSSSSSSSNDLSISICSDDLCISSSSEDEAVAEVKIVNEDEEEQLCVLREQREVHRKRHKALKEAVREHGTEDLLLRARVHVAAQRTAGEEAEPPGADQAATERGEKEGSAEKSVKRRTEEGERVEPALSVAGGTSAAAAGDT